MAGGDFMRQFSLSRLVFHGEGMLNRKHSSKVRHQTSIEKYRATTMALADAKYRLKIARNDKKILVENRAKLRKHLVDPEKKKFDQDMNNALLMVSRGTKSLLKDIHRLETQRKLMMEILEDHEAAMLNRNLSKKL